jgi:hypothetical protein
MATIRIRADRVRVGDMALHKSNTLDPRPVAEVDHAARTVRLAIGSVVTAPIPRSNYTYTRRAETGA